MKKVKEIINIKKFSVFLITLPYLAFNFEKLIHSPFFSYMELIQILTCILFIDFLIKLILFKLGEKLKTKITLYIMLICILFFYGFYITIFIQNKLIKHFQFLIRGRTIIEFLIILTILIILILRKKFINYKFLNIFLILFSVINLFTSITSKKRQRNVHFKSNFIPISEYNNVVKPIILFISDEYTSPDGLYQIYKDSSIYQFSNELTKKGWITKNSFYSYEISTIHSLSSLFNFNLSKNRSFSNEEIANIGSTKLIQASIADSLEKKNVKIINFGIFHLGKNPYLNRLYQYPTSYIEDIMMHTVYYIIKFNTGNLNKNGIANYYFPSESHNKNIFNHLSNSLGSLTNHKTFAYVHLFMPHSPMQYFPEFSIRTENNIQNYKEYWNFTNQKLDTLLKSLIKENKYKIILTGDHGYRSDIRINPHYTFTAFYGFNQESIDKVQSVQDLGSLINANF